MVSFLEHNESSNTLSKLEALMASALVQLFPSHSKRVLNNISFCMVIAICYVENSILENNLPAKPQHPTPQPHARVQMHTHKKKRKRKNKGKNKIIKIEIYSAEKCQLIFSVSEVTYPHSLYSITVLSDWIQCLCSAERGTETWSREAQDCNRRNCELQWELQCWTPTDAL